MDKAISYLQCPMGWLMLSSTQQGMEQITFVKEQGVITTKALPHCHLQCIQQLKQYFQGTLKNFGVKLNPEGTEFQKRVWEELQKIPWGTTLSYAKLSARLGDPKAIRAVGMANNKNPLAIVVPCHRVIGSDGKLVGFASGLDRKEWLLRHEGSLAQYSLFSPEF